MSRNRGSGFWGFGEENLDELLMEAITKNDLEEIRRLLREGADVNYVDPRTRNSLLHVAAERGATLEIVRFLVSQGASFEVNGKPLRDKKGQGALHRACARGHAKVASVLISHGADPLLVDKERKTPLHLAAVAGHLACVQCLLDAGALATQADKGGNFPLHLAMEQGLSTDMVRSLVLATPPEDLDHRNKFERSALWLACFHGRVGALQCLLEFEADAKLPGKAMGFAGGAGDLEKPGQSFHWMVRGNDKKRIKELVAKGVAQRQASKTRQSRQSDRSSSVRRNQTAPRSGSQRRRPTRRESIESVDSDGMPQHFRYQRSISRRPRIRRGRQSSIDSDSSQSWAPERQQSQRCSLDQPSRSQQQKLSLREKSRSERQPESSRYDDTQWETESDYSIGSVSTLDSAASHRSGFGYVPKADRRSVSKRPTSKTSREEFRKDSVFQMGQKLLLMKTKSQEEVPVDRPVETRSFSAQPQRSGRISMQLNEAALEQHNIREGKPLRTDAEKSQLTMRRYSVDPESRASSTQRSQRSRKQHREPYLRSRDSSVESMSSLGTVQSLISCNSGVHSESGWRERIKMISAQRQENYKHSMTQLSAMRGADGGSKRFFDNESDPERLQPSLKDRRGSSSDAQHTKSARNRPSSGHQDEPTRNLSPFSRLYDQRLQQRREDDQPRVRFQHSHSDNHIRTHKQQLSVVPELDDRERSPSDVHEPEIEALTTSEKVGSALNLNRMQRSSSAPKARPPESTEPQGTTSFKGKQKDGKTNFEMKFLCGGEKGKIMADWLNSDAEGKQKKSKTNVGMKFLAGGEKGKMVADWLTSDTEEADFTITQKTSGSATKFLNIMRESGKSKAPDVPPIQTIENIHISSQASSEQRQPSPKISPERTAPRLAPATPDDLCLSDPANKLKYSPIVIETDTEDPLSPKNSNAEREGMTDSLGLPEMQQQLLTASESGDLETVFRIVTDSGDGEMVLRSVVNQWGHSPLHLACRAGNLEVIKYMLQEGGEGLVNGVTEPFHCRYSPLHLAAIHGRSQVITLLASHGYSINQTSKRQTMTPLHLAAVKGQLEVVQVLLSMGADPSCTNLCLRTPLHEICRRPPNDPCVAEKIVAALIQADASQLQNQDKKGLTALHLAAMADHEGLVRCLLQKGARVNCRSNDLARTPLWLAAFHGHTGCVEALMANGADVKLEGEQDPSGNQKGAPTRPGECFHPSVPAVTKQRIAEFLHLSNPATRSPSPKRRSSRSRSRSRRSSSFLKVGELHDANTKEQRLLLWLKEVGCPELTKAFVDEGYDLEYISEHGLGEDDLDRIGIQKLGLRKKLLSSFKLEGVLGKELTIVDETPEFDRESDSSYM